MSRKFAVLSLALAMCLTILGGCSQPGGSSAPSSAGPSGQEQVSLTFFYNQATIKDGMEKAAELFMDKYPYITVKQELVTQDHVTVLKAKDAAGQLPEVFSTGTFGENALKPYIESGKICDVSNLTVVKNLPEETKEALRFSDGKIYNVPFGTTGLGVMYNKSLFAKAGIDGVPTTLDEFKEVIEKLKAIGATPFSIGAKDGWPISSQIFVPAFQMLAPNEWNQKMYAGEETFGTYTDPIFDFISLVAENSPENAMSTDYMTSLANYVSGNVGMMFYSPNVYPDLANLDQAIADDTGYFAVPLTNDPETNKIVMFTAQMFQVSSAADFDAVDKFFTFLFEGEGKEIFASDIKYPNPYGIEFEADPITDSCNDYVVQNGMLMDYQSVNEPEGFWMVEATVCQEYFGGMITREEAVKELDDGWHKIVSGQ